jgi:hypothetical protein
MDNNRSVASGIVHTGLFKEEGLLVEEGASPKEDGQRRRWAFIVVELLTSFDEQSQG